MERKKIYAVLIVIWGLVTVFGGYSQGITDFKIYLPGFALIFLGSWLYFNPEDDLWGNGKDKFT